ncbi:DUF5701 family protein [Geodermatophilus sp. SYSU D00684]
MPTTLLSLPAPAEQAERLVAAGAHERAGLSATELRARAAGVPDDGLLVLAPSLLSATALAELVSWRNRPVFVVVDMTDLDAFAPLDDAAPPADVYALSAPERGDAYRNCTPDESLPRIRAAGRTPLTVTEGLTWLLQCPDLLERNACTMTVGSRLRRANGSLDARTPALWISNGTGRDGPGRRGTAKVGWCWAGNRHTWLGIASAAGRRPLP